MIRVLLVDDQKLVREGWTVLLDHSSGISVVGQARDGLEAVELAQQLRPDVILMDVQMPRLDGLQATQQIVTQQPGVKILMVTQSLDETLVRTALQLGAWGYLSKSDTFAELLPAVLALQTPRRYFSKTIREEYPHLVDAPAPLVTIDDHPWKRSSWTYLDEQLEHAKAAGYLIRDDASSVRQQARALQAQARKTRAFTCQLLQLRHPDAPPGA